MLISVSNRYYFLCLFIFVCLIIPTPQKLAAGLTPAVVVEISGNEAFKNSAGSKSPLGLNERLNEGDVIQTGEQTRVVLRIYEGSLVLIGPSSKLFIKPVRKSFWGKWTLKLDWGTLRAIVRNKNSNKRKKKVRQVVSTAAGSIGVRGTEFIVQVPKEESDFTKVYTLEGEVRLRKTDARSYVDLPAGTMSAIRVKDKRPSTRLSYPASKIEDMSSLLKFPPRLLTEFSAPKKEGKATKSNAQKEFIQLIPVASGNKNDREGMKRIWRIMDLVKKEGVDVNKPLANSDTPLMYAAKSKRPVVMASLIELCADIEKRNKRGETALIYTAKYGELDAIDLLQNEGADLSAKDNLGKTALHYVKKRKNDPDQEHKITVLIKKQLKKKKYKCDWE